MGPEGVGAESAVPRCEEEAGVARPRLLSLPRPVFFFVHVYSRGTST